MKPFLPISIICLAVVLPGCSPSEDDSEPVKAAVAFTGKPDPAFVGIWKQNKGDATYNLKPDGTFDFKGSANTPGGKIDTSFSSTWLVDGEFFLSKDGSGNVSKYKSKIEGNKLTLSRTGTIKLDSVYIKQ